jgi:hypothetical protein
MGEFVESLLVPETPAKTNEVASSAVSSLFSSSSSSMVVDGDGGAMAMATKEKEKEQNCKEFGGFVGFIDLNSCPPEQVTENYTCASPAGHQGLDFLHEGIFLNFYTYFN